MSNDLVLKFRSCSVYFSAAPETYTVFLSLGEGDKFSICVLDHFASEP